MGLDKGKSPGGQRFSYKYNVLFASCSVFVFVFTNTIVSSLPVKAEGSSVAKHKQILFTVTSTFVF